MTVAGFGFKENIFSLNNTLGQKKRTRHTRPSMTRHAGLY